VKKNDRVCLSVKFLTDTGTAFGVHGRATGRIARIRGDHVTVDWDPDFRGLPTSYMKNQLSHAPGEKADQGEQKTKAYAPPFVPATAMPRQAVVLYAFGVWRVSQSSRNTDYQEWRDRTFATLLQEAIERGRRF